MIDFILVIIRVPGTVHFIVVIAVVHSLRQGQKIVRCMCRKKCGSITAQIRVGYFLHNHPLLCFRKTGVCPGGIHIVVMIPYFHQIPRVLLVVGSRRSGDQRTENPHLSQQILGCFGKTGAHRDLVQKNALNILIVRAGLVIRYILA